MRASRSGAKTGPNTTRTPNAGSTNAGSENRQGLTQRARRYDRSERDHGQGANSTINRKRTDESNGTTNRSTDKQFSERLTNRSAWTQQSPEEWTNKRRVIYVPRPKKIDRRNGKRGDLGRCDDVRGQGFKFRGDKFRGFGGPVIIPIFAFSYLLFTGHRILTVLGWVPGLGQKQES